MNNLTLTESIRTDLRKWCNRKKIQEKRICEHLFQYNNLIEYPKFMDLNDPLLITGMAGIGAVTYACQMAGQALEKGYIVLDHSGGIEGYCIQGDHIWSRTEYIAFREGRFVLHANTKELTHCSRVEDITPFGAIPAALDAESRHALNDVLKSCNSFSDLPIQLTKAGLKVLVISFFQAEEGLENLDRRYKNIAVALSYCEGFAAFKNRVHMRDIKKNQDSYIPEPRISADNLHSKSMGHGYCVLPEREGAVNWLYYRSQ
jgi:hypothetical protein